MSFDRVYRLALWAQSQADLPGVDRLAVAKVALRRFFAGVTLSSPDANPSYFPMFALAIGLGVLTFLAVLFQGPRKALRQFLELPGHWRTIRSAIRRLLRSARLVAVLFGAIVLSWTVWQSRWFARSNGLEDLGNVLKRRSVLETAVEQGLLASLTPLRELCALSGNLVLLLAASVLVFRASAERWNFDYVQSENDPHPPKWLTVAWMTAWIFVLYRISCLIWQPESPALGKIPWVELFLVPLLAILCDGLLFGWVLTELCSARTDSQAESIADTVRRAIVRLPVAALSCLLILPARYASQFAWLATRCLPATAPSWLLKILGFTLVDWGLVWLQSFGLVMIPVLCGAAWAGERGGFVHVWAATLRAEAGRIIAVVAGSGVVIFCLTSAAYIALLSLPSQPWVLMASDSYAHYLSLPVGLLLTATLVELADRSVPKRVVQHATDSVVWHEVEAPAAPI